MRATQVISEIKTTKQKFLAGVKGKIGFRGGSGDFGCCNNKCPFDDQFGGSEELRLKIVAMMVADPVLAGTIGSAWSSSANTTGERTTKAVRPRNACRGATSDLQLAGCDGICDRRRSSKTPLYRLYIRLYIGSIWALLTACLLRGYGRASTQNDRLSPRRSF